MVGITYTYIWDCLAVILLVDYSLLGKKKKSISVNSDERKEK